MFDLVITEARTRFSDGELLDIAIQDGKIRKIGKNLKGDAKSILDAGGSLVTESFVNAHLHLDKVYTLSMIGDEALSTYTSGSMGGAMTAIEQAASVKDSYDESWIIDNVRQALDLAVKFGNTYIHAFVDTDTAAKLEGVKAVLKARDEYKDRVEIKVIAFPQQGVIRDPGAEDYVRQAIEMGADVVGGIPWIEYTDADAKEHIDRMFGHRQTIRQRYLHVG